MPKKLKASDILTEAADSGVKQVRHMFYDYDRTEFCALGVMKYKLGLCGKEEISGAEFGKRYHEYHKLLEKDGKSFDDEIVAWNDIHGLSFRQIADILRDIGL